MPILPQRWTELALRALSVLRDEGARALARKSITRIRQRLNPPSYQLWIQQYDMITELAREKMRTRIAQWREKPRLSAILVVRAADHDAVISTIRSVQNQIYENWELVVCWDGRRSDKVGKRLEHLAHRDSRIALVSPVETGDPCSSFHRALSLSSGDFVALLFPGARLAQHAFYWIGKELILHPDTDLIFSDEDRIDQKGRRLDPWFKPDWNMALMLSHNLFGNVGVYRKSLVETVGGLRPEFADSMVYDLILRCAAHSSEKRIRHIPRILYHSPLNEDAACGRASDWEHGRRAIEAHLAHTGMSATIIRASTGRCYEVQYASPAPLPPISILVPTTGDQRLLEPCLRSLLKQTTYPNLELLLLVNERHNTDPGRAEFLKHSANAPHTRLLLYPDRPFNYSWVNNWGAAQASNGLLCFLNDDTQVITPDWLERLVSRALLPGVACAGPTLLYPNHTIQQAGVILGMSGVAGHACHGEPRDSSGYFGRARLEQDVSCITAACMVIRRAVFDQVGGFDEQLAVAYNDVDLCIRVRAAGWRIIWTPTVELYHLESASTGRHDSAGRSSEFRKEVRLMRKRWGPVLDSDPYYSPNLSLEREFQLAFPPRLLLV